VCCKPPRTSRTRRRYVASVRRPPPWRLSQRPAPRQASRRTSPKALDALIADGLQGECDQLLQDDLVRLGADTAQRLTDPPGILDRIGISEPTIGSIVVDVATVVVDVAEDYEGGTSVCTVTADAEVVVEGLMDKGLAITAEASGLVRVIDLEFNDHTAYVAVVDPIEIEAEFDATANEHVESVEDVNFLGSTLR